jgi:hypothetical protein
VSEPMIDDLGYPVAERPHPDAIFDPAWRSRHLPSPLDGWRFAYRCAAGCPDAVGSIAATLNPNDIPTECPDCGGAVEMVK